MPSPEKVHTKQDNQSQTTRTHITPLEPSTPLLHLPHTQPHTHTYTHTHSHTHNHTHTHTHTYIDTLLSIIQSTQEIKQYSLQKVNKDGSLLKIRNIIYQFLNKAIYCIKSFLFVAVKRSFQPIRNIYLT